MHVLQSLVVPNRTSLARWLVKASLWLFVLWLFYPGLFFILSWKDSELCSVARSGDKKRVLYLLEYGANPSACEHTFKARFAGWSALQEAIKNGHPDIARLLINKGADVNYMTQFHSTALMEAVKKNDIVTTIFLLDHGAEINTRDPEFGYTALDYASDEPEMQSLLVHRGAKSGKQAR